MSYTPMELAEVFLKTGELDDALDALNQQLGAQPSDDDARFLRAQIYMRLSGDARLAQAQDDISAIMNKSSEHHYMLSVIAEKRGEIDKAITAMHDALTTTQENGEDTARLIERLVKLLKDSQRTDAAIELVRQQEHSWRWLQWEADLLMQAENYHLANARYGLVIAHLQQATMRDDFRDALIARNALARAEAFRQLEQYDTAIELAKQAKRLITDDVAIDFTIGTLTALNGDIQSGLAICQVALNAASESVRERLLASLRDNQNLPANLVNALLDSRS